MPETKAESFLDRKLAPGPYPLETLRHSTAHLMASAVQRLWPGTRMGVGPSIEHGFFYDFEFPKDVRVSVEDLPRVEEAMREIAKEGKSFACQTVPRDEAKKRLTGQEQPFKLEILKGILDGEPITFYSHGEFHDLCEGPHVAHTKQIQYFKLLSVAGAYWRGDEKREQLTRIYGTAFWSKDDLQAYTQFLEEVAKRDHRNIGKTLDLFSIHPEVGPGFIFWHPNLAIPRRVIEEFWWAEHQRRGYLPVYTPHLASEDLYKISGHLENYGDLMYSPMDIDGHCYRVKPMNCPGHIKIYQSQIRSYRDLPIRYAELGTVYRYERSGVLHGMLRVRGFTQDDSHIFCTEEQLEDEIVGVLELIKYLVQTFGYQFRAYLATRPEKSIGANDVWEHATRALSGAAQKTGILTEVDPGGGAFYGPKIDFKLKDALGREWQGPTVQCDFNLPERFNLEYVGKDNQRHRPVMVHRAVLGSFERFVGGLIEHFAGKFPFWLAPTQVGLIPVADELYEHCRGLKERLIYEGFRAQIYDQGNNLNTRVKAAQLDQVPFMCVVGKREVEAASVAIRTRSGENRGVMPFEEFIGYIKQRRDQRQLEL
ncbi:MAG: threonine--tRNA ligase [Planctomycetota bacterium]